MARLSFSFDGGKSWKSTREIKDDVAVRKDGKSDSLSGQPEDTFSSLLSDFDKKFLQLAKVQV